MPRIAQLNIAKSSAPLDHPLMKEFVDNLDNINQQAEQAEGFIWRLKDESGDATQIQAFDDPSVITNLSVWRDIDALKFFVYKTQHVEFVKKRRQWFDLMSDAHYVLWWIDDNHVPSVAEAKNRLFYLQKHGDTEHAFTFTRPFPGSNDVL